MLKINKYKIGFDIFGLILFLLIMIPNIIWFSIPAPNDILRNESITPVIDTVNCSMHVLSKEEYKKYFYDEELFYITK